MNGWRLGMLVAAAVAAVLAMVAADRAGVPPIGYAPVIGIVIFLIYRALRGGAEERSRVPLKPRALRPAPPPAGDAVSITALADPALLVSAQWRVLAANEGALELFGRRMADVDLRQTVRHPTVIDAVRLALGGEGPVSREVTALGTQDGAFRVRVVALDGEDGTPARLLLTFADVTQARLTERMRADFVANASHELRTPLANISGFIETLQGAASDDEPARTRFLDIMGREAARMSRLIDDLMSLSRIELDKYVRPQTLIELPPLLADVGRTLAVRLEGDGRELLLEVEPDLPPVVADRDQILQVLHNLVSNALKYGRTGTPIRIEAAIETGPSRSEQMVRVTVRDMGEGIAPEHLPRLTERFYRIDTGRSRSMGGTGLGLAIVKHIVERHRGRLDIASRQGEGSSVSFTLPAGAPRPAPDSGETAAPRVQSQNGNTIVT